MRKGCPLHYPALGRRFNGTEQLLFLLLQILTSWLSRRGREVQTGSGTCRRRRPRTPNPSCRCETCAAPSTASRAARLANVCENAVHCSIQLWAKVSMVLLNCTSCCCRTGQWEVVWAAPPLPLSATGSLNPVSQVYDLRSLCSIFRSAFHD